MANPAALELREHFRTPEQQRETSSIGMWVFIATEVMLFGGLFMAFTIYRTMYPRAFMEASADMSILLGSINTAVLIGSSFTMALAVHSAAMGSRKLLAIFLMCTMFLGAVFLAIKCTEYVLHYQDYRAPGVWFEWAGPDARPAQMFFVFYFLMTGLHALHMCVGEGLLFTMLMRTGAGSFNAEYFTPVELTGLYWHFVDIIWVFLFAIFYIEGLHLRPGGL